MPNLSIKNVPETVVEQLRRRAAQNHRSLQGELMALVCRVAEEPVIRAESWELLRATPTGSKTAEQIASEHRHRWKTPFSQGPRAVDIVRADRDAG